MAAFIFPTGKYISLFRRTRVSSIFAIRFPSSRCALKPLPEAKSTPECAQSSPVSAAKEVTNHCQHGLQSPSAYSAAVFFVARYRSLSPFFCHNDVTPQSSAHSTIEKGAAA